MRINVPTDGFVSFRPLTLGSFTLNISRRDQTLSTPCFTRNCIPGVGNTVECPKRLLRFDPSINKHKIQYQFDDLQIEIVKRMLEGLYDMFKSNSYHSHETSGPSLLEAIERYKRYERKLVDTVKPTDETLNKISSVPARQQQARSASMGASHTRSSFNMFPNGNREQSSVAAAETSNTTVKDEEELSTTNNSSVSSKKGYRFNSNNKPSQPLHMNPYLQRQSSAHNRIKSSLVQRNGSGRHHQHHHNHRSKNQTRSKSAKTVKQIDYTGDDDDDDDDGNEDEEANSELDDSQPIVKDLPPKNVINGKNVVNITNKYDYKVIVKNLEDGYYIRYEEI